MRMGVHIPCGQKRVTHIGDFGVGVIPAKNVAGSDGAYPAVLDKDTTAGFVSHRIVNRCFERIVAKTQGLAEEKGFGCHKRQFPPPEGKGQVSLFALSLLIW